jgi:hypothetical protein
MALHWATETDSRWRLVMATAMPMVTRWAMPMEKR